MVGGVLRVLKFRLYPNNTQRTSLDHFLNQSRQCYNRALEQRIYAVRQDGKVFSLYDQQKQLTFQRGVDEQMSSVPVEAQRDGLRRVDAAFKNFFRRCREGAKKKGFPRFKSASRYNSVTFTNPSEKVEPGRMRIPGIRKPIRCRGMQPFDQQPSRLTVVRRAGKWFGRILIDDQKQPPPKRPIHKAVGIDMGLNSFLTTSDGQHVECPKYYRRLIPQLRRAQRLLSRRTRGSGRWKRALLRVQRIHAKIVDCRDDFTHKLSKQLVANYDFIAAEKLNIKGMVRSNLAKSILDAAWGQFLFRCDYKAEQAGVTFVQDNPSGTSIDCSRCGEPVPKTLSDRIHKCPKCGLTIDRDENAARNVLMRALTNLSTPGAVGVGTRTEGSTSTKSIGISQADPLKCVGQT
jgi:putative transposase